MVLATQLEIRGKNNKGPTRQVTLFFGTPSIVASGKNHFRVSTSKGGKCQLSARLYTTPRRFDRNTRTSAH